MSFTKTKLYNVALSALLLNKGVIDAETDQSNYVSNLNNFYDIALESTLQDLDLDSLSQPITLELLAELNIDADADGVIDEPSPWNFVYKYPTNCAFMRRIKSAVATDRKSTHISKRTGIYDGQRAIFTNEYQAVIEAIPLDVPLEALSPMAGLAVAYKLAMLTAPLIVGKGAKTLRKEINNNYIVAKIEAQETDTLENFNYEDEWERSEYVEARLS